jgi:hypothetical protein
MFYTLIVFFYLNFHNTVPGFVKEFHEVKSKHDESNYINKYSNSKNVSTIGYVLSLKMKQAKYKFFPWDKISIFNKEKENLENLIKANPNNLHLRYVRLIIQENTPRLLNYFSDIDKDKLMINRFINKNDETDYLDQYIKNNTSL